MLITDKVYIVNIKYTWMDNAENLAKQPAADKRPAAHSKIEFS